MFENPEARWISIEIQVSLLTLSITIHNVDTMRCLKRISSWNLAAVQPQVLARNTSYTLCPWIQFLERIRGIMRSSDQKHDSISSLSISTLLVMSVFREVLSNNPRQDFDQMIFNGKWVSRVTKELSLWALPTKLVDRHGNSIYGVRLTFLLFHIHVFFFFFFLLVGGISLLNLEKVVIFLPLFSFA